VGNQIPMQAIVVSQTSLSNSSQPVEIALFKSDGTPKVVANPAAAQVDTVAVDLAALKVDFNALLAKLRTAGVLLP
jgi:hypothetical protein